MKCFRNKWSQAFEKDNLEGKRNAVNVESAIASAQGSIVNNANAIADGICNTAINNTNTKTVADAQATSNGHAFSNVNNINTSTAASLSI